MEPTHVSRGAEERLVDGVEDKVCHTCDHPDDGERGDLLGCRGVTAIEDGGARDRKAEVAEELEGVLVGAVQALGQRAPLDRSLVVFTRRWLG